MASELLREVVFASAEVSVTVLPEAGARLHRLRAFGHDLLRAPDDTREHVRMPFFWGAYQMAPWCNRIEARPTSVAGATVDVPANFRDGSALHGQVYDRPWEVADDNSFHVSGGGDGWPWRFEVGMRLGIDGPKVTIEQTVINLAASPMPAGVGLHPWFRRPVEVAIRADEVFPTNTDSPALPDPVEGRFDLREVAAMAPGLDATWTQLTDPPVTLRWPDIGVQATIGIHSTATYVTAASPTDIDATAVEPQTHAPQGLRRLINGEPGALALLEPGGELELTTEITFQLIQEGRP